MVAAPGVTPLDEIRQRSRDLFELRYDTSIEIDSVLDEALRSGDPETIAHVASVCGIHAIMLGDFRRGGEYVATASASIDAVDVDGWLARDQLIIAALANLRGLLLQFDGHRSDAERFFNEAFDRAVRCGAYDAASIYWSNLIQIDLDEGRYTRALNGLSLLVSWNRSPYLEWPNHQTELIRVACWDGDYETAQRQLDELGFSDVRYPWFKARVMVLQALVALNLDDRQALIGFDHQALETPSTDQADCWLVGARVHTAVGDFESAWANIGRLRDSEFETTVTRQLRWVVMADLELATGDHEAAFESLSRFDPSVARFVDRQFAAEVAERVALARGDDRAAYDAINEQVDLLNEPRRADDSWSDSLTVYRTSEHLVDVRIDELMRQRRELLGLVAHDIRNSLATLRSAFGMLMLGSEVAGRAAAVMREATAEVKSIIDGLAVLDQLTVDPQRDPVDLVVQISELIEQHRERSEQQGHRIELDNQLDEATSMVLVHPSVLRTVISNLLSNAMKYSAPGSSIVVRLESDMTRTKNPVAQISVIDAGVGIGPADRDRVFERYVRLDDGRRRSGGLGLGLYITRELVEQVGGRIELESEVGVGSTFRVALPVATGSSG